MATGGIFEGLSDITSCGICFEPLEQRRPRTLSCLHVFCETCWHHLADAVQYHNPDAISCPVCAQTTKVPGGLSANLPIFFYLSKFNDIRKQFELRHKSCKICKSKTHKADISFYCFGCGSGHHRDCHVKHNVHYPHNNQISVTSSTVHSILCEEHDHHLVHFRLNCTKAICTQCCTGRHSEHKVYDLTYDSKIAQVYLKVLLSSCLESTDKTFEKFVNLQAEVTSDTKQSHDRDDTSSPLSHQADQ
ncbi:hypothetical protein LSH36_399g01007 [Paralvinella palmiformis]|uniref:RING-type domain-containing protein n=1 Tax=Paralvinella palmiformis TaxID=53620 RepID=A0AAD9JD46_9ANNE|nr:hypothetical protein LSH36_399g01007 [Paralvinella palmiformis]